MNLIAKSVWKYGIDELPKSDADSNYHIEAVEKHNVEHKNIEVHMYCHTTTIPTDKVTTTTELKLVAGKAIK